MKQLIWAVLLVPAFASADDGFVQGVVGYSSPIAGEQYQDGVDSGAARVGVRGGYAPVRFGRARLGAEAGLDWRPLKISDGESAQEFRAMIGARLAFVADNHTVFFRAAAGYDHLDLARGTNDTGWALEPGFGATYRHASLIYGAEVAVPIIVHRQQTGDDYMDGFGGADLQLMFSVGSEL